MFENNKHNSRKGFTIMEVLIVVAIIAILASLILPRFGGQVEKSAAAEAIGIMGILRQAVAAYHEENSVWPPDLTEATLGISYTTPKYWDAPTIGDNGNISMARAAGGTCSGSLTLAPDGNWSGTSDYDRATGRCWPQLQ